MVTLENVSYRYRDGTKAALRNVSLQVKPGESICLMGRNGSGKSTLVRIIAGLLKPDRGRVAYDGIADKPVVGFLFQNPDNQMVATLVEKEIAFALENRAVPLEQMKTDVFSTAQRFKIDHLLRRLTSELSGGEKQRVALASVMIQEPALLVLDEPDSYLDETGRRVLETELDRIRRGDSQLIEIRITQDFAVAQNYTRMVILDDGQIVADGRPDDVFADNDLMLRTGLRFAPDPALRLAVPEKLKTESPDSVSRVSRIKLDRTSFKYPSLPEVLKEISLSLLAGEIVGLVGPTGVGKSSLGLLVCGILQPTEGTISYLDDSGLPVSEKNRHGQVVNLLQQPERQFFLNTCAEEVQFGPSNLERPLTSDETDSFFKLAGLDQAVFADRDPFSLSAGEKRRLAFASVLSMSPAFVVFDEPTAGLDAEGIGRFMLLAASLKEIGLGQLVISHDVALIRKLADRVLQLSGPDQLQELTSDEFFDRREFVGPSR